MVFLEKIRLQKQLSHEQLATVADLKVRTVMRVERRNRASLRSLTSIASALEVDISELLREVVLIDNETEDIEDLVFAISTHFFRFRC